MFLSAFLIFVVQPMFAKMVLPLLGGAPAVWNAAMVFFQASLLAGYLYAHLLSHHVPARWQSVIHAGVMTVGALFLPFAVNTGFLPDPGDNPAPAVIVLFAVSIGFPFFALSANAPLLQSWFARTGHKDAHDPYFLYGTSNLGSVLALLAYPIVIEPFFPVLTQTLAWAAGYVLLALAILWATKLGRRMEGLAPAPVATRAQVSGEAREDGDASVSWAMRMRWIAAAAIPSSLMLGVTTNITTNVAAAPFLWVLPLALYLATFILVFDRRKALPMQWIVLAHTVLIILVLTVSDLFKDHMVLAVGTHLALFFVSALICHADLADHRPAASRLTEFYLCMSAGGVIGGAVTALLAPIVFTRVLEYPVMLAAACLFLPGVIGSARKIAGDAAFAIGLLLFAIAITYVGITYGGEIDDKLPYARALVIVLPIAYFFARSRPVRAAGTALVMAAVGIYMVPKLAFSNDMQTVSIERSFFGVSRVLSDQTADGPIHRYVHGDTVHNVQLRDPDLQREPLAYYAPEGPFGDIVRAARTGNPAMRVAAIGLGAGALACHAQSREDWTFYEIDPAVVSMATDPERFSYLSECTPDAPIVLGDARLTIAEEADGRFDLIIVDAFSSDAVPGHLVTVEAVDLYRRKLREDGLLFFHVSNRFADIGSVALAAADRLGLGSRLIGFNPRPDKVTFAEHKLGVAAVAIAKEAILVDRLDPLDGWVRASANPAVAAWTDDWSNIVGALIARSCGGPIKSPKQDQNHALSE